MLIDDIVMSGKQLVYSVGIMQIRKKKTCCLSAAQSQALSTSCRAQEEKKETACSLGLSLLAGNTIPCLGQVLKLFRTEASQIVYPV